MREQRLTEAKSRKKVLEMELKPSFFLILLYYARVIEW
jgi:hypothetical protein